MKSLTSTTSQILSLPVMFTSPCLKAWTVRYSASFHLFSVREAYDWWDVCVCCSFEEPAVLLSCIQSSFAWVFFLRWATTFKSLKAFLPTTVNVGFFFFFQWFRFVEYWNVGMCLYSSRSCSRDGGGKVKHMKGISPCWSHHCNRALLFCIFSSAWSYVSYLEHLNEC